MTKTCRTTKPARTVLEQRIRELHQSQEEFAEYADRFARAHNEPATLSVRHLQRLVAGRNADGAPIGPPRPATARLLERILGLPIEQLLAPPASDVGSSAVQPLRVAISIVPKGTDVLMVSPRESRIGRYAHWQFPAGIVKPGSSPELVAIRETLAETDIRCTVNRNLGSRIHPETGVLCEYLLCAHIGGAPRNMDAAENVDVSWIKIGSLADVVALQRVYTPVLEALGLPT